MEPGLSVAQRLESALEAATDAVAWTDAEGRVQWCNARFAALGLKPREKIVGSLLAELLPLKPTGRKVEPEHPVTAVLRGHSQLSASYEHVKDGVKTYWQLAGSFVASAGKAPIAVFWLHEVTGQRLAERRSNRLCATEAIAQEAVVCWDLDGRITHWNPAAERLYGYGAKEAVGAPLAMLLPPEGLARLEEAVALARGGQAAPGFEMIRKRKDGHHIRVWVTLAGWPDEDGELCGFTSVTRDITEQRRAEAALAHQMEELVRSNKQLEQFAATVSHDLLAPLRKVTLFGGLLEKKLSAGLDEEGRDFLGRMTSAASRMGKLIEDLMQYSRVFGSAPSSEPVDLNKIVAEVRSDLEVQIADARAEVEVGPLPTVRAHPFEMRQLFQNLLANAIKFRAKDRAPRVSVGAAFDDPGAVSVFIKDNGIGFEMKDAEKIFEPFMRLRPPSEYNGSGIGLSICRRIVLRHGGWISVESAPGRGTTFKVSFPAA